MFKRILCTLVIGSIVSLGGGRLALAANGKHGEPASAEKVKAAIAKLGTGPHALVEVELRDNSRLKGYVKEANDHYFVVVDRKTGTPTEVPYPQVKQVKGNNLSKGAKIAIVVGVVVGIVVIIGVLTNKGVISKQ